ncbi:uncharacterized protein TEOVI_000589700 [Trypanosoma equiperdum]|uniref:Uncharacterized protein n=3 Tax=Trypanozoon TaxID=39700 RepID=Q583U0_TRYB2|nr:hypothetical protein, conserved [Trypanosoma brucei brucei TREU927]AAX80467.1 hypothetical protein, conserved [Trypanosoma brucei]AAZ11627.1 hypothetical protein, conserved [Trypanosoma brucei brucei TREU927]SCU67514.1 hypothetical protein, conserved [Trypanosoma equiperdum]
MMELLQLPTTCECLLPLDAAVMAAYGPSAIYFFPLSQLFNAVTATATVTAPKGFHSVELSSHWGCCAPWHPPGASLERCGVFYEQSGLVRFRSCSFGDMPQQKRVDGKTKKGKKGEESVFDPAVKGLDGIEEMAVFFGTTLVVRTGAEALFFALDPASNPGEEKLPLIGRTALPQGKSISTTTPSNDVSADNLWYFMGASHPTSIVDEGDRYICVASFDRKERKLEAVLLAVSDTRAVQLKRTKVGGLKVSPDAGKFFCCAFNWSLRQLIVVFKGKKGKTSGTTLALSLESMSLTAENITVPPKAMDLTYTTAGEAWALTTANEDGALIIKNLMAADAGREVRLPSLKGRQASGNGNHDDQKKKKKEEEEEGEGEGEDVHTCLTAVGSTVCVLYGKAVAMVCTDDSANKGGAKSSKDSVTFSGHTQTGGEESLYAWLLKQQQRKVDESEEEEHQQELREVINFLQGTVKGPPTLIVRDCRYVSQKNGVYNHDVLDSIQANSKMKVYYKQLLRYIAIAQSLHPVTILLALHVENPSVRLSVAALLAVKPALAAGGLRLLEWGGPTRSHFNKSGDGNYKSNARREAKLFGAALLNSALDALSAGALGAVEVLCAVADITLMAALTPNSSCTVAGKSDSFRQAANHNRQDGNAVTREEVEAELTIVDCIAVLTSYARWALVTAAPSLGTITAHLAPPRTDESRRKEAMIRDRVAHAITTSRDIQIDVFPLRCR